ncbi:hypothetical protein ACFPYN_10355 [Paenisporosarcina macmurdoensis]|uniref:Uncharacterized protein n=1 Tax=Paenisporosarcina macmurdoensis TaxID=212659 RepID=A0ABW1L779_9BACL
MASTLACTSSFTDVSPRYKEAVDAYYLRQKPFLLVTPFFIILLFYYYN